MREGRKEGRVYEIRRKRIGKKKENQKKREERK